MVVGEVALDRLGHSVALYPTLSQIRRRLLDAFLGTLGVTREVTPVVHDWRSALGFSWAARHPDTVTAIACMKAIVCPVIWDDWPEAAKDISQAFRSPAGEEMILDRNLFVEAVLPASVQRQLTDGEMAECRRPFARPARIDGPL